MSHKGGRKSHSAALTEDREKRPTDSPVKEMKKKIAANAEKEKQATDKMDKTVTSPERADKNAEKAHNEKTDNKKAQSAEKVDKNAPTPDKNAQKNSEKVDKNVLTPDKIVQKNSEKVDKNVLTPDKITQKNSEKVDKNAPTPDKNAQKNSEKDKTAEQSDKKIDKVPDKKVEKPVEKKNEAEKKEESKDKPEKPIQNGASNGGANGAVDTVSDPDSSEEDLVIDDQDEVFPELTYDETSDVDFEEGAPSRSFTRRSQVKATKTPETPRPASFKEDDSKEKVLKMNDSLATDRKLRSADSPKRESKKAETKKAQDSPKKDETVDLTEDEAEMKEEKEGEKSEVEKNGSKMNKLDMDVVIEVENVEESRVRSRARVSPYTSRPPPARHDVTSSSMAANYTGNNTTMEMDISESSFSSQPAEEAGAGAGAGLDDSAYLRGLRAIRGRASYKLLKELPALDRSSYSYRSVATSPLTEAARPTGAVVGRKRKPDEGEGAGAGGARGEGEGERGGEGESKRVRLLERFSAPFRGFNTRAAEIVGINTDLPLTAPVISASSFDPETLKPSDPIAVPLPPPSHDRDGKRCILM